ncbi:hypothetical protein, partial [Streptomyces rochei]|uniref:hypothetical protein n=1 Tax=Streptomyces rochei TaxID=1928 RepID=UPI0019435C82
SARTAGSTRATRAGGRRRGEHPVVVTAAEGRAALLRPTGLLREGGRSRGTGLLVRLRSAPGSTRTTLTTGTALTTRSSRTGRATGAGRRHGAGRRRDRPRRVGTEG